MHRKNNMRLAALFAQKQIMEKHVTPCLFYFCDESTLILVCIRNHMTSKMWDEITNLFPNFHGSTAVIWEWIE